MAIGTLALKPDLFFWVMANEPLQNAGLSMQPRLLPELLGRWWSWAQHLQPLQSGLQHVADGAADRMPCGDCLHRTSFAPRPVRGVPKTLAQIRRAATSKSRSASGAVALAS